VQLPSDLPAAAVPSREGSMSPRRDRSESDVKATQNAALRFRVLIVDRDSMSSDLLAVALTLDTKFHASAVPSADLLHRLKAERADVVVIGAELSYKSGDGFDLAQAVNRAHPSTVIVILLNQSNHGSVVSSFRSGARGVFSRHLPVADFLDCVEHVRKGFIWAGEQETTFLLDAIRCIPSPSLAIVSESLPLTARELQVVRCTATGKTNKVIASELGLSEHTVKNYLFRSFEKLGVSNRVELLFYLTLRGHAIGPSRTTDPEADSGADLKAAG
jgi:two-component system nitrate/nitrite response regulator NarL